VSEPIPPYHERIPELSAELADRGCLGVIVLDTSALTSIEDEYGSDAYDEVRRRTFKILAEQRQKKRSAQGRVTTAPKRGAP